MTDRARTPTPPEPGPRPAPGGSSARVGLVSARALVAIGIAYAVVLAVGVARHGREPIADPVLAVMEALTLASAPALVGLFAAVHAGAPPARRIHGVLALVFGSLCAGTTSAVHFLELTAVRQAAGGSGLVWPSRTYAAELLAWDVFLGLALVLASRTLDGGDREHRARLALAASGVLCLAGTAGPLVGDLRLQRVGIVGYGLGLPVAAWLLARVFASRTAD